MAKKNPAHEVILAALYVEVDALIGAQHQAQSEEVRVRTGRILLLLGIFQDMIIPEKARSEIVKRLKTLAGQVRDGSQSLFNTIVDAADQIAREREENH